MRVTKKPVRKIKADGSKGLKKASQISPRMSRAAFTKQIYLLLR